jgi:hypothetical protein
MQSVTVSTPAEIIADILVCTFTSMKKGAGKDLANRS